MPVAASFPRRLLLVSLLFGALVIAFPASALALAPTAPAPASATLVDDSARAATIDVAWTAAADADGLVTTYVVDASEPGGDAEQVTVGPDVRAAQLTGLVRNTTWTIRVTAVDDAGERSATADAVLELPRLPVVIGAQVGARACRGMLGACTLAGVAGRELLLHTSPGTALDGIHAVLGVRHREPGTHRLAAAGSRTIVLGSEPIAARRALAELVHHPGVTCFDLALLDAPDLQLAPAAPTCVRWRPAIELGWAGDIVVGSHYGLPPDGGRAQFSAVAGLLRDPDLMIGNYEGTLSRGGTARCSGGPLCYIFQGPPERARNLRTAGFDVMNLANNHALDMGEDARRQTVRALQRVGLGVSGLPGAVTVRQVADTRVAIVGLTPYPGTSSLRQPSVVRGLVHDARRRGDVVVVCVHVGLEGAAGAHVPRGADYGTQTRAALHAAIDAGADVVFGSGPHVVRGVERYRGRYIVYSTGNFAGWHTFGIGGVTAQSGVVRMTFDFRGRPRAAAWDPVVIDGPGIPRPDRSGRVLRRVASLSREDFGSAGVRFTRSGRFR
jgi:hypothetical protein